MRHPRIAISLVALAIATLVACGSDPAPAPMRFLHTFSPDETELFNSTIASRGLVVESSLVPFARGQQVIGEILTAGTTCPDLIRIDATWLPGLRAHLVAPPPELTSVDWTPEAATLAQLEGVWWGVPQTVDGLIVIRDSATPAPASPSIDDLVAAARATKSEGRRFPLATRVDGYWLVPWLRAAGADVAVDRVGDPARRNAPATDAAADAATDAAEPATDAATAAATTPATKDGATRALARYGALFGDVAAPPPPAGSEAPDELRRWNSHEVAYWITGPWRLGALRDPERIAVTAIHGAPRGGQLLVVPRCAKRPADGWRLAAELASVPVEVTFANAFRTIPTRVAALAQAPALSRAAADALRTAEMLPRSAITPLLFDDLNPALAAVVAGDATAEEAIAGVRRGWARLAARQDAAPP
ncbi:MAG: hypothetical protein ACKV2T_36165 [Kofleriaceae bacterium]